MTDLKICCKEGCSIEFDIDNEEGVSITNMIDGNYTTKYYCCVEHS